MKRYQTINNEGEAEYITQHSRFIACVRPITSKKDAEAFFALRRVAHKAAEHHVPAFIVGEKQELRWTSDDGEPKGTAGTPILHLLAARGLTNVAMIVTRYFGGVKLGRGGLIRAYTTAAQSALFETHICDMREKVLLTYEIAYSFYATFENAARNGGFCIERTGFSECVKLQISTSLEEEAKIAETVADITAGTAKLLSRNIDLVSTISPLRSGCFCSSRQL